MPHRPGHQETSFFNTISELGKQRAGIPRRKLEPKRPVAQPPRTPGARPTQEGPSFAETMGQVGQQRWEENLGRNVRDDAAIAGGYGYRNPTDSGVALAQALGLNQISPAGQANLTMNVAQNYPGASPVSVPTSAPGALMADPGSVSFPTGVSPTGNINPNAVPLSVAPMLDVFRNDPVAMRALIGGQGRYPSYNPQFTGLQQNAYPWEPWNPVFGGMAATEHGPTNLGGWYGRGTWDNPYTPQGLNFWRTWSDKPTEFMGGL